MALSNLANYTAALKEYTDAIQLNPTMAVIYNNRGALYAKLGQADQVHVCVCVRVCSDAYIHLF